MRNKLKNKFKKQTAITLVALVVTIVILLILAGVSINLVLGENGIIKKAEDARDKTKIADIEEKISLALGTATIQGLGSVDLNTLNSELQKIGYTGSAITSLPATIEIDGNNYTINGNGTVANVKWYYDEDGKITDGTTTFEVGEYVNYSQFVDETKTHPSTAEENGWAVQTYTASKDTTWRILGINEASELMLVSGSPIKKEMSTEESDADWQKDPYLYMKGAYGYVNCVSTLNNICSIYNTSIGTAESMTIEDVNRALGVMKEGNIVYSKRDSTKTNIDVGGYLGNSYTYKVGDYTPEGFLADTTITAEEVAAGKKENYSSYGYKWANTAITASDTVKNMLFAETTSDGNYAKSYWLASPVSGGDGSNAYFGPGAVSGGIAFCGGSNFFDSGGNWGCYGLAVRPVITLKSDIPDTEVAKLKQADQSIKEASWKEAGYTREDIQAGSGAASTGKAGTQTN